MPQPTNAVARKLFKECFDLDEDDIYNCSLAHLGELGASRTSSEIMWRSLGIHIIALTTYGHLMSTQGLTQNLPGSQCMMNLVAFFFYPALPAVQFLHRFCATILRTVHYRHSRVPIRYWIASCLGSQVVTAGKVRPLYAVDPDEIRRESRRRNATWVGRVIVLLLLLYQILGTIAILFRGVYKFQELDNRYSNEDIRNLEISIGAAWATLSSLGLLVLNGEWHHVPPVASSLDFQPMELDADRASQDSDLDEPRMSLGADNLLKHMRQINATFVHWLTRTVPLSFQTDLEHALILKRLFVPFIAVSLPSTYLGRFTCLYNPGLCKTEELTSWVRVRLVLKWVLIVSERCDAPTGYLTTLWTPLDKLYYAIMARIILSNVLQLWIWIAPTYLRVANDVLQWIMGGRSILSFPFAMLGILLHVSIAVRNYIMSVRIGWYYEGEQEYRSLSYQKVYNYLYRFKDPWYDNMYVL